MARKKKTNPLSATQSGTHTTSCPSWFFGGPHQWDNALPNCTVKRRKKYYGYGTWWTRAHEWSDKKGGLKGGHCIHCGKTRAELKPKPKDSDTCALCGVTRKEARRQAHVGEQPKLHCEDFGHEVKRGRKKKPGQPTMGELINLAEERKRRRSNKENS